jgi:hypothetical protein
MKFPTLWVRAVCLGAGGILIPVANHCLFGAQGRATYAACFLMIVLEAALSVAMGKTVLALLHTDDVRQE